MKAIIALIQMYKKTYRNHLIGNLLVKKLDKKFLLEQASLINWIESEYSIIKKPNKMHRAELENVLMKIENREQLLPNASVSFIFKSERSKK